MYWLLLPLEIEFHMCGHSCQAHMVCCVCIYIATHMLYIYLKAVLFSYFITKILYHYFDLLLAMSVCHTALKSMKPEGD